MTALKFWSTNPVSGSSPGESVLTACFLGNPGSLRFAALYPKVNTLQFLRREQAASHRYLTAVVAASLFVYLIL